MKNINIDPVMLFFVAFILVILLIAFFISPGFGQMKAFWYLIMLLCGIGISSFFLLKKGDFFKSTFLTAYFGIITCLFLMNVQTIISGKYDFLIIKLIIIVMLVSYALYPFYTKKGQNLENSNYTSCR